MDSQEARQGASKVAIAALMSLFKSLGERSATALVSRAGATASASAGIVPALAGEVASSAVEAIAGPLLRILLKLSDETSARLERLVTANYKTGLREAEKALALMGGDLSEREVRRERLRFADQQLASAYTLAEDTKHAEATRAHISFMRALITMELGAKAAAHMEFRSAGGHVLTMIGLLDQEIDAISAQFRSWDEHTTDGSQYPMAWFKYARRDKLRSMRVNLQEFLGFIEACVQFTAADVGTSSAP